MNQKQLHLPSSEAERLKTFVDTLTHSLGHSLDSVLVYGSAVRGGYRAGSSDINILIVLEESLPGFHLLIAEAIRNTKLPLEPFIVSKRTLPRALETFAVKFQSIERQHFLMWGKSPFEGMQPDLQWRKFLARQALLNLRFRSVRAFVMFASEPKRYRVFLEALTAPLFVAFTEPLRCEGTAIPEDFADRPPVMAKFYGVETSVLMELLRLRDNKKQLSTDEISSLHSRLFQLIESVSEWTESKWKSS